MVDAAGAEPVLGDHEAGAARPEPLAGRNRDTMLGQQHVRCGVRQLAEPGPGAPPALRVAHQHPVDLQGLGQPVGRRPGQLRPVHQLGQAGPVDAGAENDHRLVENADTAHTVSHKPKLTSQNLGCPDGGSHS